MKIFLFCFQIIFLNQCYGKPTLPAAAYLLVTRVGPCEERKSSELVHVPEMSLHKEKHDSLSGELYITKEIDNGWSVKATMQKCNDIRNLDTCDFYKSVYIIRNGCLNSKEADVYNMFFQYVTPKIDCPVQPGNYTINEFPFSIEDSDLTAAESKISTSVFGYTYRLEGFSRIAARLLCLESHLLLNYVRKHDWTEGMKIGAATTAQTKHNNVTPKRDDHVTSLLKEVKNDEFDGNIDKAEDNIEDVGNDDE